MVSSVSCYKFMKNIKDDAFVRAAGACTFTWCTYAHTSDTSVDGWMSTIHMGIRTRCGWTAKLYAARWGILQCKHFNPRLNHLAAAHRHASCIQLSFEIGPTKSHSLITREFAKTRGAFEVHVQEVWANGLCYMTCLFCVEESLVELYHI